MNSAVSRTSKGLVGVATRSFISVPPSASRVSPQARCVVKSTVQFSSNPFAPSPSLFSYTATRPFSEKSGKLSQIVQGEIQHEKSNYEVPPLLKKFLNDSNWKFADKDNEVNMTLVKEQDGKTVTVEFQLVSPFQGEGEEESKGSEMTDFSVTVTTKSGSGLIFYCTTLQDDEKFRYMIGNVRYFTSLEDKNSAFAYNGPEFEDLDDSFQEALDEWLASMGVDSELCDFIDQSAIDKEQREYMQWLVNVGKIIGN